MDSKSKAARNGKHPAGPPDLYGYQPTPDSMPKNPKPPKGGTAIRPDPTAPANKK